MFGKPRACPCSERPLLLHVIPETTVMGDLRQENDFTMYGGLSCLLFVSLASCPSSFGLRPIFRESPLPSFQSKELFPPCFCRWQRHGLSTMILIMKTPEVAMWLSSSNETQSWESGQGSSKGDSLSLELELDAYGHGGWERGGTRIAFAWGISKHRENQKREKEREI